MAGLVTLHSITRVLLLRQARPVLVCIHAPQECSFHSSARVVATYRRFGEPSGRPSNIPSSSSATPLQQRWQQGRNSGVQRWSNGLQGRGSSPQWLVLVVVGTAGVYYVVHLEKVPSTGRWRFIDVSVSQEKQMGEQTFKQILAENRGKILPSNDARTRYVRSIATRIVDAMHRSEHPSDHLNYGGFEEHPSVLSSLQGEKDDVNWEVFVINDSQKNAFVLPNGKIFVYSGILPICQDADGLATVLGHEVAHQVARHLAEKASGYKVVMFGVLLLDLLGVSLGLGQTALTLLLSLPNSRKVEMEADRIGLHLMSMACFDPSKAPALWQRMQATEGGKGGGILSSAEAILSTHPLSSKRMKSLQDWLPEALETRQQAGCRNSSDMEGFLQSASRQGSPFSFR